MGILGTVFNFSADAVIGGLKLNRASKFLCKFQEKIAPTVTLELPNGKPLKIACPNELTRWRAQTYFTKEPETIEWMNTFKPGETLIDIGANIGLYTLYAASNGVKVYAFEPESQNYALINRNVFINGLSEKVVALNVALSNHDGLDYLYMPQFYAGAALNNFGEAKDYQHRDFAPEHKQAVMSYSLDSFLEKFPEAFPTHLKIDVDGLETKIIAGALKTLRDPRLKSLLIELNERLPADVAAVKDLEALGLKLKEKRHSPMSAQGDFSGIFNFIFVRA